MKINTCEKFSNEPSAKINTRQMQFFFEKKLPRKLVQAKISTIKVVQVIEIWTSGDVRRSRCQNINNGTSISVAKYY